MKRTHWRLNLLIPGSLVTLAVSGCGAMGFIDVNVHWPDVVDANDPDGEGGATLGGGEAGGGQIDPGDGTREPDPRGPNDGDANPSPGDRGPSAPDTEVAHTIFLNRFGGTYESGTDDARTNVSMVVSPGTSVTLPAYGGTDAEWDQIVACVRGNYAPFDVTVTDVEPAGGNYIEAVIGGTAGMIDLPRGLAGVAPFQCAPIAHSIVYAFSDSLSGPLETCQNASQEIAHTYGLDHVFACGDVMSYLKDCGEPTFLDRAEPCGEFEARQCACGSDTQNSAAALRDVLGPALRQ